VIKTWFISLKHKLGKTNCHQHPRALIHDYKMSYTMYLKFSTVATYLSRSTAMEVVIRWLFCGAQAYTVTCQQSTCKNIKTTKATVQFI